MRLAFAAFVVIAALVVGASAPGQSEATAARIAEPGRSIDRALDLVLAGRANKPIERTVMIVIDPSAGLKQAGFAEAFAKAMRQLVGHDKDDICAADSGGLGYDPRANSHAASLAQLRSWWAAVK